MNVPETGVRKKWIKHVLFWILAEYTAVKFVQFNFIHFYVVKTWLRYNNLSVQFEASHSNRHLWIESIWLIVRSMRVDMLLCEISNFQILLIFSPWTWNRFFGKVCQIQAAQCSTHLFNLTHFVLIQHTKLGLRTALVLMSRVSSAPYCVKMKGLHHFWNFCRGLVYESSVLGRYHRSKKRQLENCGMGADCGESIFGCCNCVHQELA